jgi:flavin reductase (DIM6/NTAB) family NADH-FMN oxidoreductase RutF
MKKSLGAKMILYPTPILVVGTYDAQGEPNLMTAAWGGLCCSVPPCVAVSLRKATYSYANIIARKGFTISIPSEAYVRDVDFLGVASGKHEDKFEVTGLTPVKSDVVDAPYVAEFPLVLECRLMRTMELGLHTLFIGEIMDVKIDDAVLDANGVPDLSKLKPLCYAPESHTYHGMGPSLGTAFSVGKNLPDNPERPL